MNPLQYILDLISAMLALRDAFILTAMVLIEVPIASNIGIGTVTAFANALYACGSPGLDIITWRINGNSFSARMHPPSWPTEQAIRVLLAPGDTFGKLVGARIREENLCPPAPH